MNPQDYQNGQNLPPTQPPMGWGEQNYPPTKPAGGFEQVNAIYQDGWVGQNNSPQNFYRQSSPSQIPQGYGVSVHGQEFRPDFSQGQNQAQPQFYPQSPVGFQQGPQGFVQTSQIPPQNHYVAPSPNQVENPYTVEYLNSIAPKEAPKFWTRGKVLLAGFLGFGLAFALTLLIITPRGDDDKTTSLKAFYHIQEAKTLAKKYQSKIKNSDLSADNAGIATSLTSDEEILEKYMTEKNYQIPKASQKKNDKAAQEVSLIYQALDKKIEDAHLASKMDEIYSREFGYQLIWIKNYIAKIQKSVGKKSRDKLEPIIQNLDGAITKYDNFLKNSK